jgi:hypothetical protein
MQTFQKAPVGNGPALCETEADAQAAIGQMNEVIDGLEAVVAEETRLVRAGQLRQATALAPRKTELAIRYARATDRIKANAKFLALVLPKDVGALGRRHDVLQATLKTNLTVLATAHAVSEGIIRRLSADLVRKSSPHVYGASGRTVAPPPRMARPLALSRTL